jgi:hypothetical protein
VIQLMFPSSYFASILSLLQNQTELSLFVDFVPGSREVRVGGIMN